MEVIRYFSKRKLLAFITASLLLQLTILSLGSYLQWTLPEYEITAARTKVIPNGDSEFAALNSKQTEDDSLSLSNMKEESELSEDPETITPGVKIVKHTINEGDTLTRVWRKYANDNGGAMKAAAAFETANVPISSLRIGAIVELQIFDKDITGLRLELYNGDVLVLDGDSETGYSSSVLEAEIIEEEKVASGVITSSFSLAAQDNNIPYGVVDQLVDIFSSRIEFRRDVRVGDTFSVMYKERRLKSGRVLEVGEVKAASFENAGNWVAAVRHVDSDGTARYYDSKGKPLGSFFLRYPVKFTRISSVFSNSRLHPVLKRRRPHNGVDFAAPTGTPVRSAANGVITVAGYRGGAGNVVKISHGEKYVTAYLHLNKIAKGIRSGTKVSQGQVIGTVGSTGLATGPHLHYSFYVNGVYTDPLKVKLPEEPNKFEAIPASYLDEMVVALKSSHADLRYARKNTKKNKVS